MANRAFGFGFSVPWNVLFAIERISNFFAKYPRSSFAAIRYGPNVPGCLSEKHFRRSHPCGRRIRWTVSAYTDRFSGGRTWNTPRSMSTSTKPAGNFDVRMSSTRNSIDRSAAFAAAFAFRFALDEHTSELQSLTNLVCRLLLEKKKLLL